MGTPDAMAPEGSKIRTSVWVSTLLFGIGFLGHVISAIHIGGGRVAYMHHILGFFLILAVTGVLIAVVGWRIWRTNPDAMLLTISGTQAIFGIGVYILTISKH